MKIHCDYVVAAIPHIILGCTYNCRSQSHTVHQIPDATHDTDMAPNSRYCT